MAEIVRDGIVHVHARGLDGFVHKTTVELRGNGAIMMALWCNGDVKAAPERIVSEPVDCLQCIARGG